MNKADTVNTVQIPRRLISLWFAKDNAIKRLLCRTDLREEGEDVLTSQNDDSKVKIKAFLLEMIPIVCLSKKMNCLTGINKGVANGKCETLRDRETSVFLCEPETF